MEAVAVAVAVAALSLAISSITAWLTLLRRGTVEMTQPTQIFFGPSDAPRSGERPSPKVYLRTLLFATSKRGRVIENMYVALIHDDVPEHFNIWVYGERLELVRGSGLFVGEDGVAANHHFLLGPDRHQFAFSAGRYRLEVVARLLGDRADKRLFAQEIVLTDELASSLRDARTGVYFDWAPDLSRYISHIERRDT
jgi:hypothetical protein